MSTPEWNALQGGYVRRTVQVVPEGAEVKINVLNDEYEAVDTLYGRVVNPRNDMRLCDIAFPYTGMHFFESWPYENMTPTDSGFEIDVDIPDVKRATDDNYPQ